MYTTAVVKSALETFASRFKRGRLQAGFKSQQALADELGWHTMTVGRYERGERLPDPEDIARIAEVLGKSELWFFQDDEGGEHPEPAAAPITREQVLKVVQDSMKAATEADEFRARAEEAESGLVRLTSVVRKVAKEQKVALDPEIQALLDKYPDDPNRDRLLLWEQSANMSPIKPGSPELENVKKAARDDKKRGK